MAAPFKSSFLSISLYINQWRISDVFSDKIIYIHDAYTGHRMYQVKPMVDTDIKMFYLKRDKKSHLTFSGINFLKYY